MFDLKTLTLEPGKGLSPRMMHKIEEDTVIVLAAVQQALARGDVSFIRYELDALLEVFQINLDPASACAMPAVMHWRTRGTTRGRYRLTLDTKTSS